MLLPVLGGLLLALAAPAPALAKHEPTYTCRASALRVESPLLPGTTIEPFHTADTGTGPDGKCKNQKAGLIHNETGLPNNLGSVGVLYAETATTKGGAESEAGVLNLTLNAPQPIGVITAKVLTSEASSSCDNGVATVSGSSTIAEVTILGTTYEPVPEEDVVLPGGIGTVQFDEETVTTDTDGNGKTITQRALVVTVNGVATVVVGEAIADVHNCLPPCPEGERRSHQTGMCIPKCNAGRGNGPEFPPATPGVECDPGRSGGRNNGGG